jgi:hypothetical protein
MLGVWRMREGFPSSKTNKRPSQVSVEIGEGIGPAFKITDKIRVPIEEHPCLIALPILALPGLLTGAINDWRGDLWHSLKEEQLDAFIELYGRSAQQGMFNPLAWFRLVAKIAHGFAVMVEGYGSFRPLLQRLILGKSQRVGKFIGCDPNPEDVGRNREFDLRLDHYCVRGTDYVGVNVRLLGELGAPTYIVIVGQRLSKHASLPGN